MAFFIVIPGIDGFGFIGERCPLHLAIPGSGLISCEKNTRTICCVRPNAAVPSARRVIAARANGARTLVRSHVGWRRVLKFAMANLDCRRSCGINPAPLANFGLAGQTGVRPDSEGSGRDSPSKCIVLPKVCRSRTDDADRG